ncbi:Uncharacterised protein [Pseudomonas luteola]|uniref:Uncharacterized protein n=1 Tax=Pseudomonas luteola TaxID=47886 RepID=A0A2X2BYM9_PSELU|nr:hypothetical protein [Pseudomonas luteola]SPY99871.1 Uncharacterised protein [Pseudomonas luteola]
MVTPPGSYAPEDACRLHVIYSEKAVSRANEMLAQFEARTLRRPVCISEFENGLLSASQLWEANLRIIRSLSNDLHKLRFPPIGHEPARSPQFKPYAVERGLNVLMVAAPSKKAAAELIGTTSYILTQWAYALKEADEAVALAEPGVVFRKRMSGFDGWQRVSDLNSNLNR